MDVTAIPLPGFSLLDKRPKNRVSRNKKAPESGALIAYFWWPQGQIAWNMSVVLRGMLLNLYKTASIAKNAWLTGKPLAGKNDCRQNRPDESPHDETEACSAWIPPEFSVASWNES